MQSLRGCADHIVRRQTGLGSGPAYVREPEEDSRAEKPGTRSDQGLSGHERDLALWGRAAAESCCVLGGACVDAETSLSRLHDALLTPCE